MSVPRSAPKPVQTSGAPEPRCPSGADLGRTAAWLAKQVELGLAETDLSLPQYRVLALLDSGPAGSSAVADRLAVRPPSVTALIDGLVARGLVERRPEGVDRRRIALTLTASGQRTLAEADNGVERRLRLLAESLDDDALAGRALDDLLLWQRALRAHRGRMTEKRAERAG